MRILFALVVAPLLALVDQSTALAMVHWSCAHGSTLAAHVAHALFLAAAVAAALFAFAQWRAMRADVFAQERFLAGVAVALAVLSALAIGTMWMPVWMISPCIQ